jgi:pimeloyl-ACP methyl ester carboxylesterase
VGVDDHTIEVAGASVFYRRAAAAGVGAGATTGAGPGADAEILYLHSVPTSCDDWSELLALTGGVAPDLLGFGRSDKPGSLPYTLASYVTFVEDFLDALELPAVTLVGHGWGAAIGLLFAERHPDRVERLAIIDAVPLLPGFTWPPVLRWLRRPLLGEFLIGSVNRWMLTRLLRHGSTSPDAWPAARIDSVWEHFDQGTQRAILRLQRSVDEPWLAAAGEGLPRLEQPALVVWGEQDPWLDPSFADAYGRRLANATVERIPGAGHWPWLDQPELTARLSAFVAGPRAT